MGVGSRNVTNVERRFVSKFFNFIFLIGFCEIRQVSTWASTFGYFFFKKKGM